MSQASVPGFQAEHSLYESACVYRTAAGPSGGPSRSAVTPQALAGGGGIAIGLGGFGGLGGRGGYGFWCELGCGAAYAACLAACGSLSGPAAPVCFGVCTGLYRSCSDGC